MPPKKEGGGGGDEPEPDEEEKEMMERELLISHLKNKLGKYQEKGNELVEENQKMAAELQSQKNNLHDINEFLTNELKAKEISSSALEHRVAELEAQLESTQEKNKEDMTAMRDAKDKEIKALQGEVETFEQKFKDLAEFKDQKQTLESKLEEMRWTLEKERKENEERISDIERKAVQEKDKLKKETALKIKETKANMMKLTDNQLETTTKRTILENEQMSSELAYQSRQTEKLLQKNEELLKQTADMRRKLDLFKQTEGELAKRNYIYQKTIKTLISKLEAHEQTKQEQAEDLEKKAVSIQQLEDHAHNLASAMESLEQERDKFQDDAYEKADELSRVEASQDEATKFLLNCLADVKQQIVTVVKEKTEGTGDVDVSVLPGQLDELSLKQRERALEVLLSRLESAHGVGPPEKSRSEIMLPAIPSVSKSMDNLYSMHRQKSLESFHSGASLASEFLWPGQVSKESSRHVASVGVQTSDSTLPLSAELQRQVVSDLRPWGKQSHTIPLNNRGTTTFLRKGKGSQYG